MASDAKPLGAEELERLRPKTAGPFAQRMLATIDAQAAKIAELEADLELSRTELEMRGRCDRCGVAWNPANYGFCPVCTMDIANESLNRRLTRAVEAMRRARDTFADFERISTMLRRESMAEASRIPKEDLTKLIEEIERNG